MEQDLLHRMPINDINHAWSQDYTWSNPDGTRYETTVFFGRCECGQVFVGLDTDSVTRQFLRHSEGRDPL